MDEYPQYSGESVELPDYIGQVLAFEVKTQGYKEIADFVNTELNGEKLYVRLGYTSPNSAIKLISDIRMGRMNIPRGELRFPLIFWVLKLGEEHQAILELKEHYKKNKKQFSYPPKQSKLTQHQSGDAFRSEGFKKEPSEIETIIQKEDEEFSFFD